MAESIFIKLIKEAFPFTEKVIQNTIKLLEDGCTIPFIARYRKEATQGLDEVQLFDIKKRYDQIINLIKRKDSILKSIEEANLLTNDLRNKIEACWDPIKLEDIYLPFKKKRKTKATVAKEQGLEPLAKIIMSQQGRSLKQDAKRFLNSNVKSIDDALEGARYIIAEWINENEKTRNYLRETFSKHAIIVSKLGRGKKDPEDQFKMYHDFNERLNKIPSHRLLAIFRGENQNILSSKIEIDFDRTVDNLKRTWIKHKYAEEADQIESSIVDALKRLLLPSIETEFKKTAKAKADSEAIAVFSKNLRELLLQAPLGNKCILALDPGFRTGCKLAVLDKHGDLLDDDTIYPHPPQNKTEESKSKIQALCEKYKIEAIAVGNGTAGKESYQFLNQFIHPDIEIHFVNESGASIYSASEVAREEFPNKDVTVRGSISIGRRLMDPLAELVKIDPKSIGVGQYQHDVDQNLLKESLDHVVSSCVNAVGINLNTASKHLLMHVSGVGPTLAENIVQFRLENGGFDSRKTLKKVPRMGSKAFEQCAGFLRINNGSNPLDNTSVHPESYHIVKTMAKKMDLSVDQFIANQTIQSELNLEEFIQEGIGLPTLKDIAKEIQKPGLDPRGKAEVFQFSNRLNSIEDLEHGMIIPGVVNNLTKFGAFVDIGIKQSGLVHISEISHSFISDPSEKLSINQRLKVKVISIDKERGKVGLSIKQV